MKDQRLLNKFWKEGNSPVFETFWKEFIGPAAFSLFFFSRPMRVR
jgi:hypothetical protein